MPVAPPPFDPVVAWGIGVLACVVAVLWIGILARGGAASPSSLVFWTGLVMAGSAVAAWYGLLARFDRTPPPMAILMPTVFAIALATGLSSLGRATAANVPLATLVGLQAFRLPLELVMHRAATVGVMPPELSYSGYNFDIATGAVALVLYIAMRVGVAVPRVALWVWNLWGMACLVVITVVAVLSSPMVLAFGNDPRHVNAWVLFFPYVWLPVVLVTIAMAGHIIVTRALLRGRP